MANEVYRVIITREGQTTWKFYSSPRQARDVAKLNSVAAEVKQNGEWVPLDAA